VEGAAAFVEQRLVALVAGCLPEGSVTGRCEVLTFMKEVVQTRVLRKKKRTTASPNLLIRKQKTSVINKMNSKRSKDSFTRAPKNAVPSSTLLASFSLSSPRVPTKTTENRVTKAAVLSTGPLLTQKQSVPSLPWYAVDSSEEDEEIPELEKVHTNVDPKRSNESMEEVSQDLSIFLISASDSLLTPPVFSLVTPSKGSKEDANVANTFSRQSDRQILSNAQYVDSNANSDTKGITAQPIAVHENSKGGSHNSQMTQQPIDLSLYYPRGCTPQLNPSAKITPLDKSNFPALGPLRRRVRALWIAEADLDDADIDSQWNGNTETERQSNPQQQNSSSQTKSSAGNTSNVTYTHRGVESIITRPIHPAPIPTHRPTAVTPIAISALPGGCPPPFSSRSLALAMSALAPVELAACLEIEECINSSLRSDLRSVQKSYMDALKELDPQQQETEMGLSLSFLPSTPQSSSSIKPLDSLSDDALRSLAASARHDANTFCDSAPEIVGTCSITSKLASLTKELYSELRRRANFESSSLNQLSDELKLFIPSLEQLVIDTKTSLKNMDESMTKVSNSFSYVCSIAAELNEYEDSVKREEELLDVWESNLGVSNLYTAIDTDIFTTSSHLNLNQTPRGTHPPSLPQHLLNQIAFAEEEERKSVSSSFNQRLTDLRNDIEARVRVIRSGEIERVEAVAREVENDLSSSFDAQMALIIAREKAAEKAITDLTSRLSSISSELVSVRTLKRLRGQVRRMWAVSQPDKLCLALDCDSEGWRDDEKDDEDEIVDTQEIETNSLKAKHAKEIADADALVQLWKNERAAAMAAVAESALRIEAEERRRLRKVRVSPLVSLGLYGRRHREMKSDLTVNNSEVRLSDSLPNLSSYSPCDTDNVDGYVDDESYSHAHRDENQADLKALEEPYAVKLANKALLTAEYKLAEAEKMSQYLRIRHERRAAALVLRKTQRHQRAAAALLAKGVVEAESDALNVGQEAKFTEAVMIMPLINTSSPNFSTSDSTRKSEKRSDLLKWRESVRKLKHEQRMRNAICRFLTQAIRAVPYDPDYAVVLKVAQKVGQRLLTKIEAMKRVGSENKQLSASPLLIESKKESSSLSLLGVIDRIIKSSGMGTEPSFSDGEPSSSRGRKVLSVLK